jgi:hypothetical protein
LRALQEAYGPSNYTYYAGSVDQGKLCSVQSLRNQLNSLCDLVRLLKEQLSVLANAFQAVCLLERFFFSVQFVTMGPTSNVTETIMHHSLPLKPQHPEQPPLIMLSGTRKLVVLLVGH